jgi:hypothetical protein
MLIVCEREIKRWTEVELSLDFEFIKIGVYIEAVTLLYKRFVYVIWRG